MKDPLVLDTTFQEILTQLDQSKEHYFITGKAGTGKSTLLQLFRKTTHKKVSLRNETARS